MMWSYCICGCEFSSSVQLPELSPGSGWQPEFRFDMGLYGHVEPEPGAWLNYWYTLDGSVWLAFAQLGSDYLLRFPGLVDYVVSGNGRAISCYPQQDVPLETVRHLLLNQVIPLALSHLGKLILHASACLTAQGAIAFVGSTGAGKSTLAASFGLRGLPILTDDCLRIEERNGQIVCYPSYPGLRLWPESVEELFDRAPVGEPLAHYTDKKRLVVGDNTAEGPFPLRGVFILANTDEEDELDAGDEVNEGDEAEQASEAPVEDEAAQVRITRLETSGALLETIKHTFQLDNTDRPRISHSFEQYAALARRVPFYQLAFPQRFTYLPAVNQAVLEHLES